MRNVCLYLRENPFNFEESKEQFDLDAFVKQNSVDGHNLLALSLMFTIVNSLLSAANKGNFVNHEITMNNANRFVRNSR
jgi:hypothetical protein